YCSSDSGVFLSDPIAIPPSSRPPLRRVCLPSPIDALSAFLEFCDSGAPLRLCGRRRKKLRRRLLHEDAGVVTDRPDPPRRAPLDRDKMKCDDRAPSSCSLNIYQSIPYITSANCIIQPSTHESVQLRRGQGPVEVAERALLFHLAGGVEQTTRRRAVERRGEADPLDAGGRELGERERLTPDADHKVDRPRHRGTDRAHR